MPDFSDLEFLDDFLDETDRHLRLLTTRLLAIEADEPVESLEETLDDLLRSFHTLKGVCGMAGLTAAADLSHAMESVLRAVQKEEIAISATLAGVLLDGVRMISDIIAGLSRQDAPACDTDGLHKRLAAFIPPTSSSVTGNPPADSPAKPSGSTDASLAALLDRWGENLPPELLQAINRNDQRRIHSAVNSGQELNLALFRPTPDKIARGVNITAIREQLGVAGRIIKAVPLVADGTISFAILVATAEAMSVEHFPDLEWLTAPVSPPAASESVESTFGYSPTVLRQSQSASVRVDIVRLDNLMRLVGDLVVSRSRLEEVLPKMSGAEPAAVEALDMISANFERLLRELRRAVMRVRLVPLTDVFSRMPLVVRDLARESGKKIRLVFEGQDTEIDKLLVDQLFDPLLHLVRNAIAHGIEAPAERLAAGKPAEGTLTLAGRPEGDHIVIVISDDGRGIDFQQVTARARSLNLIDPEAVPDTDKLLDILCLPGFSTKFSADMGSGRGVGMGVVARAVKSLGGIIAMQTVKDSGTTFTLRLPLTLVIVDAFIVSIGDQRFAIPQGTVTEVMEMPESLITPLQNGEIFSCRGEPLPIVRLAEIFHLHGDPEADSSGKTKIALIIGENGSRTVLAVDRVLGTREVVVRSVNDPLVAQPGIAGATELGDGSVVLILDVRSLLRLVNGKGKDSSQRKDFCL